MDALSISVLLEKNNVLSIYWPLSKHIMCVCMVVLGGIGMNMMFFGDFALSL